MPTEIDRRKFMSRGALLLGAAVVGVACGSGDKQVVGGRGISPPTMPTGAYRLDHCAGDCKACLACVRHAENKYFSSEAAIARAHPGCNCGVKTETMTPEKYAALFLPADAPPRASVDARWPWVASLLT